MTFIDKITKKQMAFLMVVSIPTLLIFFFPNWLDINYILGGIIINITIWSWFIILIWNEVKEKSNLRKENLKLTRKLKEEMRK